ncbi:dihydroxyacetone kinase subunit DhaL [Streptomyces sp. ODS28]|uniref:dihydroxyacetone kinase subunit DhaL n=1 Tax=Streptomyces sp. ODS28 TaxID=3136688 RepID=UPI0031E525C6
MSEQYEQDGTLDAAAAVRWLTAAAAAVDREADRLTELDSAIGDADHGSNLRRGFQAVADALESDPKDSPGAVLQLAGRQLVSTVGGASGPLYGTLLRRTGKTLGEAERVTAQALTAALRSGVDAVAKLGSSAQGDKTMLDALYPAVEAMEAASGAEAEVYAAGARAAEEGARFTVPMRARKGRASYLGERSEGHQDPGATSSALLMNALAEAVGGGPGE